MSTPRELPATVEWREVLFASERACDEEEGGIE
jgi:hypothetical protein